MCRCAGAGAGLRARITLSLTSPPSSPSLPQVSPTTQYYRQIYADAEGRRAARLATRARLRGSPKLQAQEAECRLTPITHRAGGPTLPPALRVDLAGE